MRLPLLLLVFSLCISFIVHAQSPRVSIKATVTDTAQNVLSSANVMLLIPGDSSLVTFSRTDKNGVFEFKNVKRQKYLVKVSFMGFLPLQELVTPEADGNIDMGNIQMKELNKDLMEVVIKTAKAPLSIRGDTVEYNANSFKVPPGSSVEDLLRKLPGMQVDQEGTITAQGQEVKRVTVDGKRFFGDDPKAATKNLPAEAISKVQVYNGQSEQSRITGIQDGKQEKTLNLELKDSHKKGGFGKATVGAGTEGRLEGKANYNRFNEKNQFSILGYGNNTNQSGMSWDDYQDFRGAQAANWGEDGNFGFSSRGGIFISSGGEGESLTIGPGMGGTNRGFTKNYGIGTNYNFEDKKTKFNVSYFYNQSDLDLLSFSQRRNILSNSTFLTNDQNTTDRFTGNHRGALRYENKIDSMNTLVILSNIRIGNGNTRYQSEQTFYKENDFISNESNASTLGSNHSLSMANTLIYSHKFKKKGRIVSFSGGYNINNSDDDTRQNSINNFYNGIAADDSTIVINQHNGTDSKRNQLKANAQYIEPLGKKFTWETFYNYSYRNEIVDRNVNDINDSGESRNNFLSRYYSNDITYNRLGSSIRYTFKGLNIMGGVAAQDLHLKGRFAYVQGGSEASRVDQSIFSWIPAVNLFYNMKSNKYLNVNYIKNVFEPSIIDLQPIVDNSNPLFIREGNPDLLPTISHDLSASYNMFNPGNFSSFFIYLNYSSFDQQVVQSQIVDENLVTRYKPVNVNEGTQFYSYMGWGFPIIKTKITMNFNGGINQSSSPTPINGVINDTKGTGYSFGTRLDLTLSDRFTFYPSANWSINNTEYSINKTQNQKILNSRYTAEMNVKLPADIYFNSRFNYTIYENQSMDFNQHQPILNMSVYKVILKNKKGEIRFSTYDVFNKNKGITVNAYQNYTMTQQVNTLARYYMLSFTYNMKGMSASVRRKGF